ncbi:MAG: hypothetical protein ACO2O1_05270 [Candidatus Caldarchaeales archaeon]
MIDPSKRIMKVIERILVNPSTPGPPLRRTVWVTNLPPITVPVSPPSNTAQVRNLEPPEDRTRLMISDPVLHP